MTEEITGRKEKKKKKIMLSKERIKSVSQKISIKCYTYIPHQKKFIKCCVGLKCNTHACKKPHVESANQKDHFTTYGLV